MIATDRDGTGPDVDRGSDDTGSDTDSDVNTVVLLTMPPTSTTLTTLH